MAKDPACIRLADSRMSEAWSRGSCLLRLQPRIRASMALCHGRARGPQSVRKDPNRQEWSPSAETAHHFAASPVCIDVRHPRKNVPHASLLNTLRPLLAAPRRSTRWEPDAQHLQAPTQHAQPSAQHAQQEPHFFLRLVPYAAARGEVILTAKAGEVQLTCCIFARVASTAGPDELMVAALRLWDFTVAAAGCAGAWRSEGMKATAGAINATMHKRRNGVISGDSRRDARAGG